MANRMMQFFKFDHLPEGIMRQTSAYFCALAEKVDETLPENAEKTTALRKLLEAKDCAVRATIYKDQ